MERYLEREWIRRKLTCEEFDTFSSFFTILTSSPSHTHTTPRAMRDLNRLAKIFHFNSWNKSTRTWVSLLPFPLSLSLCYSAKYKFNGKEFLLLLHTILLGDKNLQQPDECLCCIKEERTTSLFFASHQKAFFQLQKKSFASMRVRQRREKRKMKGNCSNKKTSRSAAAGCLSTSNRKRQKLCVMCVLTLYWWIIAFVFEKLRK